MYLPTWIHSTLRTPKSGMFPDAGPFSIMKRPDSEVLLESCSYEYTMFLLRTRHIPEHMNTLPSHDLTKLQD